jgi:hypothetical protein
MKIETNKASGFILNYLVMVAEGHNYEIVDGAILTGRTVWRDFLAYDEEYSPSTNRDQGYEIVDRKKININYCRDLRDKNGLYIHAEMNTHIYHGYWRGDHEKPLIAAMRCYVASELGEEVDVPDELTELGETK